jgi:hypothetical protein
MVKFRSAEGQFDRLLAAGSKQIAASLRWLKTEWMEAALVAGGGRAKQRMNGRDLAARAKR